MYQYKTRLFCKNYEAQHEHMSGAVYGAAHKAFDYIEGCIGFRDHELSDILLCLTGGDDALMGHMVKRASKMVAHLYVWEKHTCGKMARMTYEDFKRVKKELHPEAKVVGLEWEALQYRLRVEPWFYTGQHHWILDTGNDAQCFGESLVELRYNYISTLFVELCDELATQKKED